MLPLLLLLACHPKVQDTAAPDTAPVETGDTGTTDSDTGEDTVPPSLPAVVVNELMAANDGAWLDDAGLPSDWIELYNAGFETADLSGYALTDDWTAKNKSPLPSGTVIDPGGYLLFRADGTATGDHLAFSLAADGEAVGLFSPDGQELDWLNYPAQADDWAWTRLPDGGDTWDAIPRGTPGAANVRIEEQRLEAVESGFFWRYLDTGVYPGDDWVLPTFRDTAWFGGPSPLGYGDYQATVVLYGPDAGNKYVTTWFRTTFEVPEAGGVAFDTVRVGVLADDGAVIYVNGVEALRVHMPEGDITPDTLASYTVSGTDETTFYAYDLDPTLLIEGTNVLAVEVHQVTVGSSDLTLDLTLTATRWASGG